MKQPDLNDVGPEDLIELVTVLQSELQKKKEELARARLRLTNAKLRISRLKGIVVYQRQRIITLYA